MKSRATHAVTRKPSENFSSGITTSGLGKPDYKKALIQHEAYCEALKQCGLDVITLDADDRYPDSCFVEDTAVVLDEIAVITSPGAESRRGEENEIEKLLAQFRMTEKIRLPGTLDGGDILRAENHFFIGRSARTNAAGSEQLSGILKRYGYESSEIKVEKGLHLKSGLEYIGKGIFISAHEFSGKVKADKIIILDPDENYSANCLLINDNLLIAKGFPGLRSRLDQTGYMIIELEMSEFRKMDGGLTCLSLVF